MDMEKVNAKLDSFAQRVIKDAAHKAGLLLNQAREEKERHMEEKELSFLKDAYHSIQEAINRIEKENNEVYSSKLFEAKQLLFQRRQEIIDTVFEKVRERLEQYRNTREYDKKLKTLIEKGLAEVGPGDIAIIVEDIDRESAEAIKKELKQAFVIEESDEPTLGGCMVFNRTTGLMADHSFLSGLNRQRDSFLELSGLNINL